MKENIKIALLGVIALTMIVDTFVMDGGSGSTSSTAVSAPTSNVANPATPQPLDLNNPAQQPIQPTEPPVPSGPPTSIQFAQMEHSFGTIDQDSENTHVFEFTNTGDNPLIIQNAQGSCGCTVPEYPKEPIAPGATGEIKVVYKPGKQKGNQTKTVTITANTDPITTQLKIGAEVLEVEGAGDAAGPTIN